MANPAYLSRSRHGIFYFRWPLPPEVHPQRRRTDIKVSLSTCRRREALRLSRLLSYVGEVAVVDGRRRRMRYDEIRRHVREHFEERLAAFREQVGAEGLPSEYDLSILRASQSLAEQPLEGRWDVCRRNHR